MFGEKRVKTVVASSNFFLLFPGVPSLSFWHAIRFPLREFHGIRPENVHLPFRLRSRLRQLEKILAQERCPLQGGDDFHDVHLDDDDTSSGDGCHRACAAERQRHAKKEKTVQKTTCVRLLRRGVLRRRLQSATWLQQGRLRVR